MVCNHNRNHNVNFENNRNCNRNWFLCNRPMSVYDSLRRTLMVEFSYPIRKSVVYLFIMDFSFLHIYFYIYESIETH